jgi:hypothetical protein
MLAAIMMRYPKSVSPALQDMAAMKINAITNRGSKKDFSDLLLLHEQGIPILQSLEYFCAKYGQPDAFWLICLT